MLHSLVTACTATGDTTKTLIDTVTMPAGARKIVGLAVSSFAGPGCTTLENISGIVELESSDFPNLMPQQYLLDQLAVLTNGVASQSPRLYPCNIPCKGGERVSVYVTMDMALTVANKARAMIMYDDGI